MTQLVNRRGGLERQGSRGYNLRVLKSALLALVCTPLLMGGACEKKPETPDNGAAVALEAGSGSAAPAGPVDTTPLQGIDLTKIDTDKQQIFYKLIGSLESPCGKGNESLRKSYTTDTSCKRAPLAVRYVVSLLQDEVPEAQVREAWEAKYKQGVPTVKLDVSHAPHAGTDGAPIRLVEFYDYGCPHCQAFKPMMEKVLADEQGKVVEYFMQFPLEKHENSKSAASAALAANAQGKFKEMHDLLFENAPNQNHEQVTEMAKKLGLDMTKFEADYAEALPQVESDLHQGEGVGVDSTPTLFFNTRKYEGPMHPRYIEMWIDEELAVNR